MYDGDALVAEYNSSNGLNRRYVHGDQVDEPWVEYGSSSIGAGNRTYLHADHQGSIIARTDGFGGYLGKLTYDSFGIPATTNEGRFGYTGQIWFKELGLFHYKARMYSPKLGRFLQIDPIFYADQMNMYAYVGNDPVNMVDPTGEFGVVGFAIGFIADAIAQHATTGKIDFRQSVVSGAVGFVTGGAASLAKASMTVGGKLVATTGEKVAANTFVATSSATAGAGAHAVNTTLDGKQPTVESTAKDAVLSAAGPGKAVGDAVGAVAAITKEVAPSLKNNAADVAVELTKETSSKTMDSALDERLKN